MNSTDHKRELHITLNSKNYTPVLQHETVSSNSSDQMKAMMQLEI